MKQWKCTVCGQVFEGDIPPVPCPVCGAGEDAFEAVAPQQSGFQSNTGEQFVIIGGGLAGLAAARAIRQRNATASITLVSGENHLPYNRPALGRVVAEGLPFASLLLEQEGYYAEKDITVLSGVVAEAIKAGEKTVALSNGDSLPYTKLLLATGATPYNPIKHSHGAIPVKVLRCYEDAVDLAEYAAGKRVVLVGGGILGLEAAVALQRQNAIVTVVESAPRVLPLQTDEAVSAKLAAHLESMNIGLLCGASVTEAVQHGLVLSDGAHMAADLVLASMGVRSEVSLAVAMGLNLGRGIEVDRFMHTSHPDIWAAGDCAEFDGRVQAMAGAASAMGAVAGASMAGDESEAYRPFVPATALTMPGFTLFSVGAVNAEVEETVLYEDKPSGQYRRLFFSGGSLSGALFVGKNPGGKALQALADHAPLQEALALLQL